MDPLPAKDEDTTSDLSIDNPLSQNPGTIFVFSFFFFFQKLSFSKLISKFLLFQTLQKVYKTIYAINMMSYLTT